MATYQTKKTSVIELFPVRGKQKYDSPNNFTPQTRLKNFLIKYIIYCTLGFFSCLRW